MIQSVHLIVLPIVLPLLAGAGLLLIDERRRNLKATLAFVAVGALVLVAMRLVGVAAVTGAVTTYRLGNWDLPFAIVLVHDRLSSLMVLLTAVLAFTTIMFAIARCVGWVPRCNVRDSAWSSRRCTRMLRGCLSCLGAAYGAHPSPTPRFVRTTTSSSKGQ